MNNSGKKQFVFSLLVLAIACGRAGGDEEQAAPAQKQSGNVVQRADANLAPDFTLPDIDGKAFSLSSLRGKVVIIDLWATWCPPCVKGVPDFADLYRAYSGQGLEIVGISLDRTGPGAVKKFVRKYDVPYTMVMGNMKVLQDYRFAGSIPTTYIIDRQGKIVQNVVGLRPKSFFEEQIKKLL
ncbi:MAG: TlpA disulfide reductase family protein [Gemmatimonadota bacterium]|nr:TlpA disulfide reductase family protein [Gemmatimonadota bacterium]